MAEIKKLSAKHKQMAEYMVLNPTAKQAELQEKFELTQVQVSVIQRSPVFKAEIERLLQEQWAGAKKTAQNTMIRLAEDGDYKAAEFILRCNGINPTEKVDVSTGNTIQIKIE